MARFIVLEMTDAATVEAAAAELDAEVRHVAGADDAAQAVLAAVRGACIVVITTAPREVVDELCDDLGRLGIVDHRIGPVHGPILSPEERALLARLLAGATLGDAARALHISRRTADRRLAAARATLAAGSTPEALRRAAELGIHPVE